MTDGFRCAPAISARALSLRGRDAELDGLRVAVRSGAHVLVVGPSHSGCTRLVESFRRQPGVRVVDDGHRLDATARQRLLEAPPDGSVLVIAMHAEGRAQLAEVTRPWQGVGARAVLLGPIGRDDQVSICEDLLSGPVDRSGCDALFSMSGGRPGDLVELVLSSLEVGVLRLGAAGWALTGPPSFGRLVPSFEERLGDPVLRGAARAIARAGPAAPVDVAGLVRREHLDRLQAIGVISVQPGSPTDVTIARPALAAWLRRHDRGRGHGRRRVRSASRPGRSDGHPRTDVWDVFAHAVDAAVPEARRRVAAVAPGPPGADEPAVSGSMARVVVAARSLDAAALARESVALRAAPDPRRGLPRPRVLADVSEVERRAFAGLDVTELTRSCAVGRRRAAREGRASERALWNVASASVAIAAGRPQRALALLAGTRALVERTTATPGVALITVRQAWASVQSGAASAAQSLLDAAECRGSPQPTPLWRAYLEAMIRWVVDPAVRPHEFDAIGRHAISLGDPHLTLEVAATQLRLEGTSPTTLEFAEHLEGRVDGGRVRVLADHARAVAAGDPDGLVAVAIRWCAAGRLADAADALLRAATLESGRRRHVYRRRAAGLLGACEGAWNPRAHGIDRVELDDEAVRIGHLVLRGLRNQDIGERVGVSTRAIEARLSRMYRQLGVSGRRELDLFFSSMLRRASTRAA